MKERILVSNDELFVSLTVWDGAGKLHFCTNSDRVVIHLTHDEAKRLEQLDKGRYLGAPEHD